MVFANWNPGDPPLELEIAACLIVGGCIVGVILLAFLVLWGIGKLCIQILDDWLR